ncbi:P-loop NTPase fold protein [Photobacterium profundum]|uniref:KAP NTPase domain-containing protein n=1 Tax=Photobacterium profundum (strain SS9) TaxID=298386 RepID=Q6LLE4_PHOPR|nr:P-loop NTPase fold protein [Photobacterium profundum]CAG21967.1 Conserved hypothetical protein [Photobacterium profundum SS9]
MSALGNEFDWSKPYNKESDDKQSFETFPADQLDRAKYAEFLTNYLVEEGKNGGYVLNLNARWGTGKTYFLNRWKADLEKQYPVVYIDAWKQDYSDDPLLTVVASIISQLRRLAGDDADKIVLKAAEKAIRLFKVAAPAITKGLVKKATGVQFDDIAATWQDDSSDSPAPMGALGVGDAAGKVVQALIDDHNAKLQGVDTFKESMAQWIKAIIGKQSLNYPAFILIDELDRCRPSYAVEMLEVIKHFFDMKDVVFVVATDTEQLQHAVKAVYGVDFNAATYLGRFFRRRCTLQEMPRNKFIAQKVNQQNINIDELAPFIWPDISDGVHRYTEILANTADAFYLPLREVEQLVDKVYLIMKNRNGKKINLYHLASFLIIHDKYSDFYHCYFGERKPKGPSSSISDISTIMHYIDDANINIEVEIGLTPSQHFPKGLVTKGNVGYSLDFHDGYYKVRFDSIVQAQIEVLRNSPNAKYYHDQIAQKRSSQGKLIVGEIMKYELALLKPSLSQYKDWIELAATFDN